MRNYVLNLLAGLLLAACADDPPPFVAPESAPDEPICSEGEWRLAAGFRVDREVDYIADRITEVSADAPGFSNRTLSSAGVPCTGATDKAKCQAGLDLPGLIGQRHLITTEGESVRIYNAMPGNVLGRVDTKAEALWWVLALEQAIVTCDAKAVKVAEGYHVENAYAYGCGPISEAARTSEPVTVWITSQASLLTFPPPGDGDPCIRIASP